MVSPQTTHGTPFVVPVDVPEVIIPLLGVVTHDGSHALTGVTEFFMRHRCVSIGLHSVRCAVDDCH
jgi:hypothetical protein